MGSPRLVCVDPEQIFDFWPHARPLIKNAIEATSLSNFDDIEREILDGNMLLWLAWSGSIDAAAVTRLIPSVLEIVACSGHDRNRWISLLTQIEQYARDEKCSVVRILGRRGWERVLDGYHVEHVILEKAL